MDMWLGNAASYSDNEVKYYVCVNIYLKKGGSDYKIIIS
jgi:hypothetical protein